LGIRFHIGFAKLAFQAHHDAEQMWEAIGALNPVIFEQKKTGKLDIADSFVIICFAVLHFVLCSQFLQWILDQFATWRFNQVEFFLAVAETKTRKQFDIK